MVTRVTMVIVLGSLRALLACRLCLVNNLIRQPQCVLSETKSGNLLVPSLNLPRADGTHPSERSPWIYPVLGWEP